MIDTTMRREARFTWRQRPPLPLALEALMPTTDMLRTTITSTMAATTRTRTGRRRTTHNLRGHQPLCTIPTFRIPMFRIPMLTIPTRTLKRTGMIRIISNRGTDTVNHNNGVGVMAHTDEQYNQLVLGCYRECHVLYMYRSCSSSVSVSSIIS